ncbi:MAG: hypothetical protein AAFV53_22880 [Myxococcota bacterium]
MAQFGDFLGRLFSTGGSRGLSGDVDLVLPAVPELAFYNEGLFRHHTDGDLALEPGQLWAPSGRYGRKGGLNNHLMSDYAEGVIDFTDVIVIINQSDWSRAVPDASSGWPDEAARTLSAQFAALCEEQNIHLLFPQRPVQFHIIQDGGPRMEGESLGLGPGEFVTGLLSNQYGRPTGHSRALIAVHLNLPGTWEGYYEVGRLYNDQALFTLGNHWLDNFNHPALPRPALYRLQQQADGSFIHVIDPDVAEQYEITSQNAGEGPSVLTIQDLNGEPVAHLVLEVVTDFNTLSGEGTIEAQRKTRPPASASPAIAAPQEEVTAVSDAARINSTINSDVSSSKTVVPAEVSERILTLREQGALLQKVHFSRFMLGYDVYVGASGEVGTSIEEPLITLQVRRKQVMLVAHRSDLRLNGAPLAMDSAVLLEGDAELSLGGGQTLTYRDLRGGAVDGWPYVGEIVRNSSNSIHLLFGKQHQLGRARSCRVSLPDKPHNDNIIWRPEVGEGATIRARSGEIPKSQFYTDSIMVASMHAEIDLGKEPMLISRARHCFTFVRRGEDVFSLFPTKSRGGGQTNLDLQPGDQILIGNSVFGVDYPPASQPRMIDPTPVSPDELAAAIDEPGEVAPGFVTETDLPPAAGLGERGNEPPPVRLGSKDTEDSIVGIDLPQLQPKQKAPAAPMLLDSIDESMFEDSEETTRLDVPPISEVPSSPPPVPPGDEGPPPIPPPMDLGPPPIPDAPDAPDVNAGPPLVPDANAGPPPVPDANAGPPPVPAPPMLNDEPPPVPSVGADWVEVDAGPPPVPPAIDAEPYVLPSLPPAMEDEPPPLPSGTPDSVFDPMSMGIDDSGPIDLFEADEPTEEVPMVAQEDMVTISDEDEVDLAPPIPEPAPQPQPMVPEPSYPTPVPEPYFDSPGEVVIVEESDWQVELARPSRLVLVGWAVSGEVVVGNHRSADVIIPENRGEPDQTFSPEAYFTVFVRGRRLRISVHPSMDAVLMAGGQTVGETKDPDALMEITRRDPDGEPDFVVPMTIRAERMLMDPRARLLEVDVSDPMVAAMFTLGLPLRADRRLHIGKMEFTAHFNGEQLQVSDYLETYRVSEAEYLPFFIKHGDASFRTAPEDGASVELSPGDHVMIGAAVYRFEQM